MIIYFLDNVSELFDFVLNTANIKARNKKIFIMVFPEEFELIVIRKSFRLKRRIEFLCQSFLIFLC